MPNFHLKLSEMEVLALAALDDEELVETMACWAWSRRDNPGDHQIGVSKSRVNRLICEARIPTDRRVGLADKITARAKEQMDAEITKWFLKLKPTVMAAEKHIPSHVRQIVWDQDGIPATIRRPVATRLMALREVNARFRTKKWW